MPTASPGCSALPPSIRRSPRFSAVVLSRLELRAHGIELRALGEVADREDRPEHLLKPDADAILRFHTHLQEVIVRRALHLDQVRHRGDLGDAPKGLADPLLAGEGNSHAGPSLWAARLPHRVARFHLRAAPGQPRDGISPYRTPNPGVRCG